MIERANGIPYYLQIVEHFVKKIEDGEYKVGDKLPSENELSGQFGVNRITVRQAIAKLASQGWIETLKGKGSFVKIRNIFIPYVLSEKTRYSENIGTKDHKRQLKYCEKGLPTPDESEMLKIGPDEEVYRLEVTRIVYEELMNATKYVMVEKYFPELEKHLDDFQSITDIAQTCYGFRLIRISTTISTMFPSGNDIQHFPENIPVLRLKSLIAHPSGYPLMISDSRNRGDMVEIICRV
jgi:Transcriptional regulators